MPAIARDALILSSVEGSSRNFIKPLAISTVTSISFSGVRVFTRLELATISFAYDSANDLFLSSILILLI